MITHLQSTRALDGTRALVGSETEGGLSPHGEVMLLAKLFFNFPPSHAHTLQEVHTDAFLSSFFNINLHRKRYSLTHRQKC